MRREVLPEKVWLTIILEHPALMAFCTKVLGNILPQLSIFYLCVGIAILRFNNTFFEKNYAKINHVILFMYFLELMHFSIKPLTSLQGNFLRISSCLIAGFCSRLIANVKTHHYLSYQESKTPSEPRIKASANELKPMKNYLGDNMPNYSLSSSYPKRLSYETTPYQRPTQANSISQNPIETSQNTISMLTQNHTTLSRSPNRGPVVTTSNVPTVASTSNRPIVTNVNRSPVAISWTNTPVIVSDRNTPQLTRLRSYIRDGFTSGTLPNHLDLIHRDGRSREICVRISNLRRLMSIENDYKREQEQNPNLLILRRINVTAVSSLTLSSLSYVYNLEDWVTRLVEMSCERQHEEESCKRIVEIIEKNRSLEDLILKPNDLICPISRELMKYPVTALDGKTYEFDELHRNFSTNQSETQPSRIDEMIIQEYLPELYGIIKKYSTFHSPSSPLELKSPLTNKNLLNTPLRLNSNGRISLEIKHDEEYKDQLLNATITEILKEKNLTAQELSQKENTNSINTCPILQTFFELKCCEKIRIEEILRRKSRASLYHYPDPPPSETSRMIGNLARYGIHLQQNEYNPNRDNRSDNRTNTRQNSSVNRNSNDTSNPNFQMPSIGID
ncbi:MAG: hypothetical protein VX112_04300 [Pseudomonadota bacterium]|nr:hypothetical protein [Pseudomonadota bacterium]